MIPIDVLMWRGKASAPQPRQGPAGTDSWNSFPFPLNLLQGSMNPWSFLEVPQTLHSRRWLWPLFQPHSLLPSLLQTRSTTCHLLNKVGISLFKPCSHCLWPTHVSKLTQNSQHSVSWSDVREWKECICLSQRSRPRPHHSRVLTAEKFLSFFSTLQGRFASVYL